MPFMHGYTGVYTSTSDGLTTWPRAWGDQDQGDATNPLTRDNVSYTRKVNRLGWQDSVNANHPIVHDEHTRKGCPLDQDTADFPSKDSQYISGH
jgi:hypothetical protein